MDTTQASQWLDKLIPYLYENGPKLLGAVVVVFAGVMASGFVARLMQRWLDKKDLEPPVKMLVTRITRLFIIAFAIVIALGTCGINITPMVAMLGVAGVGVGLAMQGVLGNLICGLVIIFTKPFRVGEYIEIIGCTGLVKTIDLFTTVLAHPDRSLVIIPNRKIVGEVLHNYGTIRQQDIIVGVAYDTNLPAAIAVINGFLANNPKVLKDPAPVVAVSDFGDSSINILVKPWCNVADYRATGAEIKLALVEAFRSNKIQIPFPQREVRFLNPGGAKS